MNRYDIEAEFTLTFYEWLEEEGIKPEDTIKNDTVEKLYDKLTKLLNSFKLYGVYGDYQVRVANVLVSHLLKEHGPDWETKLKGRCSTVWNNYNLLTQHLTDYLLLLVQEVYDNCDRSS